MAPAAVAGPPAHPALPAQGLLGFDHACGTAVDSQGDVYVSSAGESKIEVFDPNHVELASIADSHEPCGLAIDSHGALFVAEKALGTVVRYLPDAYPLSTGPTYGPAETIDASGNARGIAVDASTLVTNSNNLIGGDDSLYIAKGSHVDVYGDERQRIQVNATGGTYTLTFAGQTTAPLPYNASHEQVQEALELLSTVGEHNVSVTTGNFQETDHLITFVGALGLENVNRIDVGTSGLTGGGISQSDVDGGFLATAGEGALADATGVAAYAYKLNSEVAVHYLVAADAATKEVKIFSSRENLTSFALRKTIKGPREGEDFGFGPAGAYLAIDPGNANLEGKCAAPVGEQACTAGHFVVLDASRKTLDEFEADGRLLDQVDLAAADAGFADAQPSAMAIDRSGGTGDGTIFVTSGSGAAAKLLAFGPLTAPARPPRPALDQQLQGADAVGTDSAGDVYVVAERKIHVFDAAGKALTEFEDGALASEPDIAIDSTGKVYVLDGPFHNGKVTYYTPSSFPPTSGTTYARHEPPVATTASFSKAETVERKIEAIGINPANDHLFVVARNSAQIIELDSAAPGHQSAMLDPDFGGTLGLNEPGDVAVDGSTGEVYVSDFLRGVRVLDPTGSEEVARIVGTGSPGGRFDEGPEPKIAVDQTNGHVLMLKETRSAVEEYDASGAFVGRFFSPTFGEFQPPVAKSVGIAVDNGPSSPNSDNLYVAYDEPKNGTPDLWAFGPLAYGGPPIAVTGMPNGFGGGSATLRGTVDPRGIEVSECRFELLLDARYRKNIEEEKPAFEGATLHLCTQTPAEIGAGTAAVTVSANVDLPDPAAAYRYRLAATNKYGEGRGEAGLFGAPKLTAKSAFPVLYDEAVLRAEIEPFGLATTFHFEYGPNGNEYDHVTPSQELPAGEGGSVVKAVLTGLAEGVTYHFRIVVENADGREEGPDQVFTTQQRRGTETCGNSEYRIGLSANLPDCRAYELVTPSETAGLDPRAAGFGGKGLESGMNDFLAAPDGESLTFFTLGTLPGFPGNGRQDGYRSMRGEGIHPVAGWGTQLVGPSYVQAGGGFASQLGVAADQSHSFWQLGPVDTFPGTLAKGMYLRTPLGFEAIGHGEPSPGQPVVDLSAEGRALGAGGSHVVFASSAHLEPGAAPAGTEALYDRSAGAVNAEVLSVKPDGSAFAQGEGASYVGGNEDASAAAFQVGGIELGTLYLHRSGKTTEIAEGPSTFAGVSADGTRVFYASGRFTASGTFGDEPLGLFFCDVRGGSCAGPEKSHDPVEITANGMFVNVSADGSRAYFISTEPLTPEEETNERGEHAVEGEDNLYQWDGNAHFVARVDPEDLLRFDAQHEAINSVNLVAWPTAVGYGAHAGRAKSPTRSTSDGAILLFQSHAQLTGYDNTEASASACGNRESGGDRCAEVYRFDAAAPTGRRITCVSCDPSGAAPRAAANLETTAENTSVPPVDETTLISNLSAGGERAFFQSRDRLVPEDANHAQDVYEWQAVGAGGCDRLEGCLALISSGQGEEDSHLYGMSSSGSDVFFTTKDQLVPRDVAGSPSIYDARTDGGIPEPVDQSPCQGDSCQGEGSVPPTLPAPSTTAGQGNVTKRRAPCAKGRHRVKGRCVPRHARKRHRRRQAGHHRRAAQ